MSETHSVRFERPNLGTDDSNRHVTWKHIPHGNTYIPGSRDVAATSSGSYPVHKTLAVNQIAHQWKIK